MAPQTKKPSYLCDKCDKTFASRQGLHRHKSSLHNIRRFTCDICSHQFNRKDTLKYHIKSMHSPVHQVQVEGGTSEEGTSQENPCSRRALKGTMEVHTIQGEGAEKCDPMNFLRSHYEEVKRILKTAIREKGSIKWYLAMNVKMTRRRGESIDVAEPVFRGKCQTGLKWEDLEQGMKESMKKIYTSFIEYQREGSNWTVDKVLSLIIKVKVVHMPVVDKFP